MYVIRVVIHIRTTGMIENSCVNGAVIRVTPTVMRARI